MEYGDGCGTPGGKTPQLMSHRTPGGRRKNRSGGALASPATAQLRGVHASPASTQFRDFGASAATPQSRGANASPASQFRGVNASPAPNSRQVTAASPTSPRNKVSPAQDPPMSERMSKVFKVLPIASSFKLVNEIGEGTFSTVYLARAEGGLGKSNKKEVALKHLTPTSKPGRIMMEVRCMREAAGHPNVINLLAVWRVGGDVVLAMPYIKHCRFIDLVATAELEEVKSYIANLLSALEHIHRLGIIHRDIKPSNFLYDRNKRQYALVDFGLAQREEDPNINPEPRGRKRRGEEETGSETKKPRLPLVETSNLNCSPRPLQALKGQKCIGGGGDGIVRRSPRKTFAPLGQHDGEEQEILSPAVSPSQATPKQRLDFPDVHRVPIRCSPRKLSLNLTNPRRVSGDSLATPSPTLQRTPSYTALLEPNSQATDNFGRTPLLRASLTSHHSSTLPSRGSCSALPSKTAPPSCNCPGHLKVCSSCNALPHLHAARAGTPGFRPPEVLMKNMTQTVAVDMWAVGVTFLSLLSRSYPFFRAPDDLTALAELATVFGTKAIRETAAGYGRIVTTSPEAPPEGVSLGPVCRELALRGEVQPGVPCPDHVVTDEAIVLLKGLLALDYRQRISASKALKLPFFKDMVIGKDC